MNTRRWVSHRGLILPLPLWPRGSRPRLIVRDLDISSGKKSNEKCDPCRLADSGAPARVDKIFCAETQLT